MKEKILLIYKKLLSKFGKQNWWPAESDYEIIVGAILTQNTNWKNVERAILNLKSNNKLRENAILKMKTKELEQLIKPSGFYKQKAKYLKNATKKWIELKNKTENRDMSIDEIRKELLSVKGVGKETADTIILYAFNKPIFIIDSYTRRFCKSFFNFESKNYEDYRTFFENNLPKDTNLFKEYHALIVEWGKRTKKGFSDF